MTNCNIILLYTEYKKVDSCPERKAAVTAVTAGGVVGALLFIIGIEFLFILLLWKFRRLVVIQIAYECVCVIVFKHADKEYPFLLKVFVSNRAIC